MPTSSTPLILGTRGSLLARAQSQLIADALMRHHPNLKVELRIIKTTGDRLTNQPLTEEGGKGLFAKELQEALLANQIDFAVHSYKDVPVTMPLVDQADLIIAAVPKREDPADVLILRDPKMTTLPPKARIGTSSLRRRAQILTKHPTTQILPLRGNIDTRLRKLHAGEFDAIILAAAGLKRTNLFDPSFMKPIDILPAPAQGALALECRKSDNNTRAILATLNDQPTTTCVNAERALVELLHGDCHSPIAALATLSTSNQMRLQAAVAARDGNPPVLFAQQSDHANSAGIAFQHIVTSVFQQLSQQGAMELLHNT